jgi:homocysteine S-methyltransferase
MVSQPLPQLHRPFLTDGGLETDMVFNRGIDLPHFASISLLRTEAGRSALDDYFRGFLELAEGMGTGLILESATWRASSDWSEPLGLSGGELDDLNREAIAMLARLREEYRSRVSDVVVSGCIGPRGDGYDPGRIMPVDEATAYHRRQAQVLAGAGADMLTAITMTNVPEAIGVTAAARELGVPVAISFTVETDGRLPSGDALADAVPAVDEATNGYPAYFMINCAHPTHFSASLEEGAAWSARIAGVRANASRCSHAELDAMTELDEGDPADLARLHRELRERFPQINVLGGCCGTDLRHVTAIAQACLQGDGGS